MRWNVFFVVLFLIGVIASAYFLYELPDRLIRTADDLGLNNIDQVKPALNVIYLSIGLTFAAGLAFTVLTFLSRKRVEVENEESGQLTADTVASSNEEEMEEEILEVSNQEFVSRLKKAIGTKKDQKESFEKALSLLSESVEASQGAVYLLNKDQLELFATYAFPIREDLTISYEVGEGIIGQVGKSQEAILIKDVPEGYLKVFSGLGESSPTCLYVVPLVSEKLVGVMELSSFHSLNSVQQNLVKDAAAVLAQKADAKSKKKTVKE